MIIALLMLIGVGLVSAHLWEKAQRRREEQLIAETDVYVSPERMRVYYNDAWYELRNDLETYLVMGLDKVEETKSGEDNFINNQQADFLFLVIVDKTNKCVSALHINRDTMAEIQQLGLGGKKIGTYTGQLALAHTYGTGGRDSCRNMVQAVSRFLYDVPIDHYFSLTMDAVPVLNDLVGGVTVHIDDDFSAVDPTLEQGKDVLLKGQQALTFVRNRRYLDDSSNLQRMNRQRAYIDGLYRQIMAKLQNDDRFGAKLASQLSDYSLSDLTTSQLSDLGEKLKNYPFTSIYSIKGETVLGEKYMEFYADEEDLQKTVINLFFREEQT